MKRIIATVLVVLATASAGWASGFVQPDGKGGLVLDGKPYKAIGVNMPTLFSDYIAASLTTKDHYGTAEKSRQHVIDGVNDASKHSIAFMRFWPSAYWPANMTLYFENPQKYWESMDEVFALCRSKHVKLVPSIFFNIELWTMWYGEDRQAIIDPNSKSYAAMHKYAKEIVSRYKDDTNVLMWELSNENFLSADVNQEGRQAPHFTAYQPGAPNIKENYNFKDSLTTDMIQKFYKDMASYIKSIDPNHMVESGDASVRDCSLSLRKSFPNSEWNRDTLRENVASDLYAQCEPLDMISLHCYGPDPSYKCPGSVSTLEYGLAIINAAHAAHLPVFVGETGCIDPSFKKDPTAKWTMDAIDAYEKSGADLVAVWAWYFPDQAENTFTSASLPGLVKRIEQFNKKHNSIR